MRSRINRTVGPLRTIIYMRVSTEEQRLSGAGLEAQRQMLTAEVARRGWQIVWVADDAGLSAKNLNRPQLQEALAMLDAGQADVLMAAKLDRLSRSAIDMLGIAQRAERQGWSLVVCDLALDTTTPMGRAMLGFMSVLAQLERDLISERTKLALAIKKEQGVKIGRPSQLPDEIVQLIIELRRERTFEQVAAELNIRGVRTSQGALAWSRQVVAGVLAGGQAKRLQQQPTAS